MKQSFYQHINTWEPVLFFSWTSWKVSLLTGRMAMEATLLTAHLVQYQSRKRRASTNTIKSGMAKPADGVNLFAKWPRLVGVRLYAVLLLGLSAFVWYLCFLVFDNHRFGALILAKVDSNQLALLEPLAQLPVVKFYRDLWVIHIIWALWPGLICSLRRESSCTEGCWKEKKPAQRNAKKETKINKGRVVPILTGALVCYLYRASDEV